MAYRGFRQKEIHEFRGAWGAMDKLEVRPERAFLAQNVRFPPGRVKTRDGTVAGFSMGAKVTSMLHWFTSVYNKLIVYEGTKVRSYDMGTGTGSDLFTLSGRAASIADAGSKCAVAVFATTGLGAGQARIVHYAIVGAPCDIAFPPPWTDNLTLSDVGAGNCTEGTHYFAFLPVSRSGFPGKPSPAPGDTFTPTSYAVAAGGRKVRLTIGPIAATPASSWAVQAIMTRADNPNRWYKVPNAIVSVLPGIPATPVIDVDISDDDLAARADEITDKNFFYLSQTVAGGGPFSPSVVVPYGNRMVYVVDSKAYISDPYDYEVLTEDQHAIQIAGQKRIITALPLKRGLYLLGPNWTYGTSDAGTAPRQWPVPEEVSDALGTTAPLGVEWRTAGDYGWVANEKGLWYFDGRYPDKPVSYLNTDFWDRINWNAAYAIQVREHIKEQRVYVAAPLDSATEPTHLLVWDFTRGYGPEEVDFSYDVYTPATFSSIAMVNDPTSMKSALWIGPSAAGTLQKMTSGAVTDAGAAIVSTWESGYALTPRDKPMRINRFGCQEFTIKGAGPAAITLYGRDRASSAAMESLTLSTAPGCDLRSRGDFSNENASTRITTNGVGSWFDLSMWRPFWRAHQGHN